MKLRDYPLKPTGMLVPANVEIIARERGKRMPKHCRHSHNIWVDLGREFIARVIAPNDDLNDHWGESAGNREYIQYMGVGIGGDSQWHSSAWASPLKDDYPPGLGAGLVGNLQTDDSLAVTMLERPVALNITGGSEVWLGNVKTPVTFLNDSKTLRLDRLFTETECNLEGGLGPYTIVPLSEVALFLSKEDASASNVYDGSNPPTMVGAGRQTVVSYNTFEAIPKTVSFSLEVRWELRL